MPQSGNEPLPGQHESYWVATTPKTGYPAWSGEQGFDVVVVGGGIAGITTAYLLKQAGKKVAVLEAGRIVEGATGYTTAKVTSLHTLIYKHVTDHLGRDRARLFAEAQQSAIEMVASLAQQNAIDCDFIRSAAYTYTASKDKVREIEAEVEAAQSLGLPASLVRETSLPYPIEAAVRFDNQAHFHPRKYLLGLAERISGDGSAIFETTRATSIEDGLPCIIKTEKGEIRAGDVVVATHYPILNDGFYFARLTSTRSYALGAHIDGPVPEGMFINIEEPLYSVRTQPSEKGPLLIITGQKQPTGRDDTAIERYRELERLTRERFPVRSVEYYWSTQDSRTLDRIAYIGKYTRQSKHLFVAAGFGGWGMTNGTVSGMLLSDMILGRKNPWVEIFDPARVEQVKSAGDFISTNANIVKELAGGLLPAARTEKILAMPNGSARVVDWKGQKIAVYKDEEGSLHGVSAKCTHMGCTVSWNNAEKSWDCPCHGSRFDINGDILDTPALSPLAKKEITVTEE